jgi:probable HAF family extracellular repeat protein
MRTRTRILAAVLVATMLVGAPSVWLLRDRQRLYKVTFLPSLGGKGMGASAINDRGQIVGGAQTRDGQLHLFLWDRQTGIQDLGPAESRFDINNAGQICGTILDPAGNAQAFLRDPDRGIILLGTLGGKTSRACALNNRGQVAGISETAAGFKHAFLWDPAQGMRDLGTLGGNDSQARAINDAGEVFGLADAPQRQFCPFVWDPNGGMVPLPLSAPDAYYSDLNNHSSVVGWCRSSGTRYQLVLWSKEAGVQKVLDLDCKAVMETPILNDAAQIVFGEYVPGRWDALLRRVGLVDWSYSLWDPNLGRIPLGPYLRHAPGWRFWPQDINNKGAIVGVLFSEKMDRGRAVLLEPIPERWRK